MLPVRSSLIVGAGAIASRILGFVRDILFASVLGAGPVADAFLAAFRLPNAIRRTLSEGGLNPALVPALARLPADEAPRFAGEVFSSLAVLVLALVAAVELTAGLAVLALAPGLADDPGTLALAAHYTRLAFPLVVGVTLASLVSAVLNHRRRYLAATLAPLVLNGALAAGLVAVDALGLPLAEGAAWLAGIASLAGFAQLALLAGAFRGADAPIRLSRPRRSGALRKLLAGAGLTLVAGGAAQFIVLVGMQAASFLPSGVSWLYYADRLVQLPLGALGAVIGIVLLPELAGLQASGDDRRTVAAQNGALAACFLIAAPAALALALLAEPIAAVLFERGAFGPEDTRGTAAAMAGMSLGLPFAAAGKVLTQSLFARGETRPALRALVAGLAATAGASLVLTPPLGALGLGLAVAAGLAAHTVMLAVALQRDGLLGFDRRLLDRIARTALATAALGLALTAALSVTGSRPGPFGLAGLCGGGLVVYALAALATGALPVSSLRLLAGKT